MSSTKLKPLPVRNVAEILTHSMYEQMFPSHLEVIPQISDVYELELAYHESQIMSDEELIRNAAYFARVNDTLTRHFLMCSGEPVRLPQHSSSRLRSFFASKQFKTGYATHGLFPYRGKFHPQMIKGLLNIMGLKPGDTVLDPMMGSGTVLIEASLMGIKSVGIDASPFCRFMVQAKLDGLIVPLSPIRTALTDSQKVFEHFTSLSKVQPTAKKANHEHNGGDLFANLDAKDKRKLSASKNGKLPVGCDTPQVYNFLLLAYLDSAGYSERSSRKSPYDQFKAILERYLFVAEKIQRVLEGIESELAESKPLEGDARSLPLEDASIDGVIFSPPYSFAIDYLDNDAFHLNYLGIDAGALREGMVGLRGQTLNEKFGLYKADMNKVLSECARVLRPGGFCTIVVGTNNNQLSKILEVSPDQVPGIDDLLVEYGKKNKLSLARKITRPIIGMANTMRLESILMLERQ